MAPTYENETKDAKDVSPVEIPIDVPRRRRHHRQEAELPETTKTSTQNVSQRTKRTRHPGDRAGMREAEPQTSQKTPRQANTSSAALSCNVAELKRRPQNSKMLLLAAGITGKNQTSKKTRGETVTMYSLKLKVRLMHRIF